MSKKQFLVTSLLIGLVAWGVFTLNHQFTVAENRFGIQYGDWQSKTVTFYLTKDGVKLNRVFVCPHEGRCVTMAFTSEEISEDVTLKDSFLGKEANFLESFRQHRGTLDASALQGELESRFESVKKGYDNQRRYDFTKALTVMLAIMAMILLFTLAIKKYSVPAEVS